MSSTMVLVTAHPISAESAQALVASKASVSRFLVLIPSNTAEGYDTLLTEGDEGGAWAGLDTPDDMLPSADPGAHRNHQPVDYGVAQTSEATAIAGSVSTALQSAQVAVDSRAVPHKGLPEIVARLAQKAEASEVVIATHSISPARLMGTDLAARVKHALEALGSDIPVDRHHF
jgi:hypothetical protein